MRYKINMSEEELFNIWNKIQDKKFLNNYEKKLDKSFNELTECLLYFKKSGDIENYKKYYTEFIRLGIKLGVKDENYNS